MDEILLSCVMWCTIIGFLLIGGPFLVAAAVCLSATSIEEFYMKKVKPLYKRIRREWTINPRERIHEGKRKADQKSEECSNCQNRSIVVCLDCEHFS